MYCEHGIIPKSLPRNCARFAGGEKRTADNYPTAATDPDDLVWSLIFPPTPSPPGLL